MDAIRTKASVLLAVLCGTTPAADQPAAAPSTPEPSAIHGIVVSSGNTAVPGATVVLCDGPSGIPLLAGDFRLLSEDVRSAARGRTPIAVATANDLGRFSFTGIPAGTYRLVAQSWEDAAAPVTDALAVNGPTVHLRGVADSVTVTAGASAEAVLRALGDGVLIIDQKVGNSETLVAVSTAPTTADPILGFAGWAGPFTANLVGANRMPTGRTTIRGLPRGTVHLAVFSADNSPGWGAGSVTITGPEPLAVRVPFVAGWSDAVHSPPPRLHELIDDLKDEGLVTPEAVRGLVAATVGEAPEDKEFLGPKTVSWLAAHLADPVELPSKRAVPAGDLMAAAAYMGTEARAARAGRPRSPYTGIEVRQAPQPVR